MNCSSCGKAAQSGNLCGTCLVKIVEKRARKAIQKKGVLPNAKIIVVNDGSCEGEVNLYLAGKFRLKNLEVRSEAKTGAGSSFVCIPDTADKIAGDFLDSMLNSGSAARKGKPENTIRLLGDSLSEEVLAYAKAKRISFRDRKEPSAVESLLNNLESQHRGSKFALSKSAEFLDNASRD